MIDYRKTETKCELTGCSCEKTIDCWNCSTYKQHIKQRRALYDSDTDNWKKLIEDECANADERLQKSITRIALKKAIDTDAADCRYWKAVTKYEINNMVNKIANSMAVFFRDTKPIIDRDMFARHIELCVKDKESGIDALREAKSLIPNYEIMMRQHVAQYLMTKEANHEQEA